MQYHRDRINTVTDFFTDWPVQRPGTLAIEKFTIENMGQYHEHVIVPSFRAMGGDVALLGQPDEIDLALEPGVALINQGRWVVWCPMPDCFNAMITQEGWPFLCAECGSEGRYRRVVWPAEAERAIATLLKRKMVKQRSWDPEKLSIDELEGQTEELGY